MTVEFVNGACANYNSTAWHGVADLAALSRADVCTLILEIEVCVFIFRMGPSPSYLTCRL